MFDLPRANRTSFQPIVDRLLLHTALEYWSAGRSKAVSIHNCRQCEIKALLSVDEGCAGQPSLVESVSSTDHGLISHGVHYAAV